jgi:hypothetical protein
MRACPGLPRKRGLRAGVSGAAGETEDAEAITRNERTGYVYILGSWLKFRRLQRGGVFQDLVSVGLWGDLGVDLGDPGLRVEQEGDTSGLAPVAEDPEGF